MSAPDQDRAVERREEVLRPTAETIEIGGLRATKRVEEQHVAEHVTSGWEEAETERLAVEGEDSGEIETLPDGSVSIPLFAEELVIERRMVVRERVIIRKRTELTEHLVEADLRHERLELDAEDGVEVRGDVARAGEAPQASA